MAKYAIEDADWEVTSLVFWPGDCRYHFVIAADKVLIIENRCVLTH
jgi:hypothetical protein